MKTGIIDVGGGMRDSYGAGVLDWCMDNGIKFDYCIGVSAGAGNLSSYLSGQRGRNYVFYTDYDLREESMSLRNYVKTRNFVDLDYTYGTLSNTGGEYPLDFEALMANPAEFRIVATDAFSGKPRYFDKTDMSQDDYGAVKASSCVPAANRPYYVNGAGYYDGGMSDPIPLEKCFEDGCDKVVIILTRPYDFVRDPKKDRTTAAVMNREFPQAAEALRRRAQIYNTELWLAKQYEAKGKVLIIAPDDIGGMKTLTRDPEMIKQLYHKGYEDAEVIEAFIEAE